ncbi:hypothetical protein FDH62_gp57 [Arthrobacter phage Pumancara]|uniref:Uncharacterized protein n=1 Tax=Arthrobacter phage Pumancara TaxID=1772311 RepID=A0A0U4INH6_9CAUD|nr:hypothetical protein FDH62_gp57 [Arthrobacter phage Pumancara]ALY10015.1 hypothetical protein PUMANCARA_57 [Arthrobacter phage Pumancara]
MTVDPTKPLWDPEPMLGFGYHPFMTQAARQLAERRAALEEELCTRALETGYGVMIIEGFPDQPLASVGMVHPQVPAGSIFVYKWGPHIQALLGEHGSQLVLDMAKL